MEDHEKQAFLDLIELNKEMLNKMYCYNIYADRDYTETLNKLNKIEEEIQIK